MAFWELVTKSINNNNYLKMKKIYNFNSLLKIVNSQNKVKTAVRPNIFCGGQIYGFGHENGQSGHPVTSVHAVDVSCEYLQSVLRKHFHYRTF